MRNKTTTSGVVLCKGIGCYQLSDQKGSVIDLNLRDLAELREWFSELTGRRPEKETGAAL